jgi:acyl carrier protein
MSVKSTIISAMQQIAEEQKVKLPPLDDNLSLHETGFDSLAFAILVARLEDDLGLDTYADERFFSYRRSVHRKEPDYGRHIHAIALEG